MFEAGVRSGDILCVLTPTKLQDNLIGAKISAMQSLHARGVTRVEMDFLKDKVNKTLESSFEEL